MNSVAGGATMSIEISATAVVDLITGRLTPESFEGVVHASAIHYLKAAMNRGLTISSITLKRGLDNDDDLVVITFGDQDAARSLFHAPEE